MKRAVGTVMTVVVLVSGALGACSSTVGGTGGGSGQPTATSGSGSSSPSTASSATDSTPTPSPAGDATSATPVLTPTPTSTHTTTSPTATTTGSPSSSVSGPALVLSVDYTVTCSSHADPNGTVLLSWHTTGADAVYVLPGPIAGGLVGADAKAAGGTGPLAPNGSSTFAFSCADDDYYYLVEAYNGSDSSHNGVVEQVPYA